MSSEQQIFLQRREIMLKILSDLIGYWDFAEWLYVLVLNMDNSPELIDSIEKILIEATDRATDTIIKQKMNQGIIYIQKMREKEDQEREEEKRILQFTSFEANLY